MRVEYIWHLSGLLPQDATARDQSGFIELYHCNSATLRAEYVYADARYF